jgi:hypothetical protein
MRRKPTEGEPITENRRVVKIGSSFYLNLPPEFVAAHNIKPGDKVAVTSDHLVRPAGRDYLGVQVPCRPDRRNC